MAGSKLSSATVGWFDGDDDGEYEVEYTPESAVPSNESDYELLCPCCGQVIYLRHTLTAMVEDTEKK